MISEIAYTFVAGKPLIFHFGILTLLSFLFTAIISVLNTKGIHIIPFKWHPRMAIVSLVLAVIHGLMGMSSYFGF